MDKLKQWVALTIVAVLAVLAAGWFLLVSPKRSDAATIRTDADSQQRTNMGLQSQVARLKAQQKELPQKQAQLAAVAAKIPDNPALPALIRALSKAADDTGVELVSLSPSTPVVVAPSTTAQTLPQAAGSSSHVSAAPVGAAAGAAAGTLKQIPISISVVGGYFQIESFFDRMENLSRALKVSSFSVAPGVDPTKPVAKDVVQVATDPGKVLLSQVSALVYMASDRTPTPTAPVAAK